MTLSEAFTSLAPAPGQVDEAPTEARARRRYWMRWHPAWIVVIGACAVLFRIAMYSGLNTDVFWHLAAGQWMLHHHSVIRTDVFSYTVRGRPWFAEEWGFEVLLAEMVHHIGAVSYWLISGVACALALLASALRWSRQGADRLWIAALSVPTAMAIFVGDSPRPQSLSYLLFALELLVLTLARRQRAWLLSLPVLFLFWSNLHGSFIFGAALLALELLVAVAAEVSSRATATRRYLRFGD